MNKLKMHLDDKLKDMVMDENLKKEILDKTVYEKADRGNRKRGKAIQGIGIAAAVMVFCMTSVTVAGAVFPKVCNWLYERAPKLAEFFYPVEESCEREGIRVTVVAGINDDHNADVYFTIQDETGKGRTTDKVDFMDSAGINGSRFTNVELLDYNEEDQTALYVLHESGGEDFSNRKNTFRISRMMLNKRIFEWFATDIQLKDYMEGEAETKYLMDCNYSGGGGEACKDTLILKPDVMNLSLGSDIDFVTITNIGMIDGKLHIQTKWSRSFDNHGEFWLLEKGKEPGEYADSVPWQNYYFNTEEDLANTGNNRFAKHIEFVYDTDYMETPEDYVLWARIVKDGEIVEAKWEVDFVMGNLEKIILEPASSVAAEIQITPISVYLKDYNGEPEECQVMVKMKDGSKIPLNLKEIIVNEEDYIYGKGVNVNFVTGNAMETEEIESVFVDQEEIPIRQ